MLLGDFDIDDYYRIGTGVTVLFVIFTLFGVVILLNVLIALVSDSYEVARMRSGTLFGLARISFIAQHEALEQFLQPGTRPLVLTKVFESRLKLFSFLSRLFKWLVLMSLIATAMVAEVFLVRRAIQVTTDGYTDWATLCLVGFLSISLAFSLWIMFSFAFERMVWKFTPSYLNRCTRFIVRTMSKTIFGSPVRLGANDDDGRDDEWSGRMTYIERMFERSQQQTKKDVAAEISSLEQRIYEQKALTNN